VQEWFGVISKAPAIKEKQIKTPELQSMFFFSLYKTVGEAVINKGGVHHCL